MAVQLESEIDFQLSLGNFDGPFDLLLTLIGRHELDITEISLARVTAEFIEHVRALEGRAEIESASEFLVVAATLIDLKLASLLPAGEAVDGEDIALLEARDLLFARLLQYRAFKQVSAWFENALSIESNRLPAVPQSEDSLFPERPELIWETELGSFAVIAEAALRPREIPSVGLTHLHASKVSIREQSSILITRLRSERKVAFRLLLSTADRPTFVARFLAVLELYRRSAIKFEQSQAFTDFQVEWIGDNLAPEVLANLWEEYEQ